MKYFLSLMTVFLFVSCASNPHWDKTEENHDNAWTEKSETYRALSSVDEREKDKK